MPAMDRAPARHDGRDRTRALNEAVEPSLDVDQWQTQHIQEGIRQADAGEFASDAEVAAAFSRWRDCP
jgi:RHH-type transcriptional regulator, rel operon repressor / antitoxin RelB